jgi:lysophospholipase L1-like esterase
MITKNLTCAILLLVASQAVAIAWQKNDPIPSKDSIKFYDGQDFTIIGKFHDEKGYARFPQKYKNTLRPEVWDLGQNSAGISIRFRSNATDIIIKWTVIGEVSFPHMASTGVRGVDLYANVNGTWQFIGTGRPKEKTSEYNLLTGGEPVYREYLLNLPLYDGVESISIGVNFSAEISKPKENFLIVKKPVVYYGTSIAQGGCASRPGMAFTNILSRKLDRSFINMGFSGQGTFDSSVGEAICEVDAVLYIIDCNPNTEKELIYNRAVKLVLQLKKKRPEVPVLLVENYIYTDASLTKEYAKNNESNSGDIIDGKQIELRKAFETLKKSGIINIYYQTGNGLIGNDYEATVDGVHPSDLGMYRMAEFLWPQINNIINKNDPKSK